jgi:hypothetical protein
MLPGFGAVHCSYCFPRLSDIIRKLQTSGHTEYGHGKYVDPDFIVARVLCGQSLFQQEHDKINLVPKFTYELSLPARAERLLWRFPFVDLDEFNFNISLIQTWALCDTVITHDKYQIRAFD